MMAGNSVSRTTAFTGPGRGRKRAFPTPSRRTWKLVSAVTLSASFVATVAFQHSVPLSHNNHARSSTAINVLTDPTNMVKIESKQSVEDRAALEELYLLSFLAKKATGKKTFDLPESKVNRAKVSTSIDDGPTSTTAQKDRPTEMPKPSEKVRFKGLTTVPNRRNQKQKKTLDGPLSKRIKLDEDEYIRNLLEKKEELLSEDSNARLYSAENAATSIVSEQAATVPRNPRRKTTTMVRNSLSSTMPGFMEGKNTLRKQAYSNGIKIAQKNSNIDFVETAASKKKRVYESGQAMYKTSRSVPDSLVQFANEIHAVDRITPEEEIELGEKTQEALRLQHIHDDLVTKLEREPTDDEWCAASGKFNMEAITQIIEEGLDAKDRLVTSNLRMVQGVVNVYIRNGIQGQYNAGDLMQEGILVSCQSAISGIHTETSYCSRFFHSHSFFNISIGVDKGCGEV